jgi:Fe-S cluster assembly protein SufD
MGAAAKKQNMHDALLNAYPRLELRADWAVKAQDAAAARFAAQGAPGPRDEYWRYTNPATLTQVPAPSATVLVHDEAPIFDALDRVELVFVDGVFRADLSGDLTLAGCSIELLTDVMATDIHWASEFYGTLEAASQERVDRPMAALNSAVANAGVVIHVTGTVEKAIALRYLHQNDASDVALHHVIKVDAGASVTVLESGPSAARFNKVVEIDVADGGTLNHVRAQGRDHERRAVTGTFARLGKESVFKSFTVTVNGVLTRNETVIDFTGDDAVAHVAGACVGDGEFLHDDTVFITHDGVNCESRQVFKKVLRNGAVGVFQGKILVQPDAQKTDGYQISQGLLLDDDSQFLAKPELEIYADDVACSHGSTCGSVDEDQLFYLTSRGIDRKTAGNMLVLSFLAEAIEEIEDEAIAEAVLTRLGEWMERRS